MTQRDGRPWITKTAETNAGQTIRTKAIAVEGRACLDARGADWLPRAVDTVRMLSSGTTLQYFQVGGPASPQIAQSTIRRELLKIKKRIDDLVAMCRDEQEALDREVDKRKPDPKATRDPAEFRGLEVDWGKALADSDGEG